jgi:hypothetical protein
VTEINTCHAAIYLIWLPGSVWSMITFAKRQLAYFAQVRAIRGLTRDEFPLWGEPNHPSITVWSYGGWDKALPFWRTRRLLVIQRQPEPQLERSWRAVLRPIYLGFALTVALLPAMRITEHLYK